MRAFVGGQVTQVGDNFKEGGVVKQGELLLTIDDFEYKSKGFHNGFKVLNKIFRLYSKK